MTRVKICGVRRVEDAVLAASLGADAIGFIFWPRSPRFIDPFAARAIVRALPPGGTFWREHFYFAFPHPPFASIATLIGIALLIWGAFEMHAAGCIKDELESAEEERRKRALVAEMEAERKKA